MVQSFTDIQTRAISHSRGMLMVQAAAGSGKTTVLANRCANLIAGDAHADVSELLVVTFTREAAAEMRHRIARALREKARLQPANRRLQQQAALVDHAHICTFDSFCAWLVRTWFTLSGQDPGFTVMDAMEARLAYHDCLRQTVRDQLGGGRGREFAAIFAQYADGSVGNLAELIAPLESMWNNLPDPETWAGKAIAELGNPNSVPAYYLPQMIELYKIIEATLPESSFPADKNRVMANFLTSCGRSLLSAIHAMTPRAADAKPDWEAAVKEIAAVSLPPSGWRLANSLDTDGNAQTFRKGTFDAIKTNFYDLQTQITRLTPQQLQAQTAQAQRVLAVLLDFHRQVRKTFTAFKTTAGQLDFSDIAHAAIAALKASATGQPGPLMSIIRKRFVHILVDEYQDINPVQQELIQLVSPLPDRAGADDADHHAQPSAVSFFGVGDVHQSIYAFRGSEPALMDRQCAKSGALPMPDNFRSLPPLIDGLNIIFNRIFATFHEKSHRETAATKAPALLLKASRPALSGHDDRALTGGPVALHVFIKSKQETDIEDKTNPDNADEQTASADILEELSQAQLEAEIIAAEIKTLIGGGRTIEGEKQIRRPARYSDIVILLRAVRHTAVEFIRTLQDRGIPAFAELRTGFFESQEVLETLELLNVLDNPAQDIAIASVLLGQFGDFSRQDLYAIRRAFPDRREIPFHAAVMRYADYAQDNHGGQTRFDAELAGRLKIFLATLDRWGDTVRTLGVADGLARIFHETNLFSRILARPYGDRRVANLRRLHEKALDFGGFQAQGLAGFNAFIQNVQDHADTDFGQAPLPEINAVRVMSVHASKGLEFPIVFAGGMGKKFKLQTRKEKLLATYQDGIGLAVIDPASGQATAAFHHQRIIEKINERIVEEEARILYVTMTRARDYLALVGVVAEKNIEDWKKFNLIEQPDNIKRPLDWLGPVFYHCRAQSLAENPALTYKEYTLQSPIFAPGKPPAMADDAQFGASAASQSDTLILEKMRAFEPLPSAPDIKPDTSVQAALQVAEAAYPFAAHTTLPAVCTISQIKSLAEDFSPTSDDPVATIDQWPARALPTSPSALPADKQPGMNTPPSAPDGATRGSLTHLVLERLDFSIPPTTQAVGQQIAAMTAKGILAGPMATAISAEQIAWFLNSPPGRRIARAAAPDNSSRIMRELTFFWTLTPQELAATFGGRRQASEEGGIAAQPTADTTGRILIRGAIDLLLIDQEGLLIVDYKTDAPAGIAGRLAMYELQVQLYVRAAREILNIPPVTPIGGILAFLSTREIREVPLA